MDVLIPKNVYLPYSEVFIYEEVNRFSRFNVYFLINRYSETQYFPRPENYVLKPWINFLDSTALLDQVGKMPHDIIYFQFGYDAYYFFTKVRKRMSTPVIVALRGADISVFVEQENADYTSIMGFVDLFLVRSEEMATRAERLGIPSNKIRVLYTGIDVARFRFIGAVENPPYLCICCGRLVRKKGIEDIIMATALISEEISHDFRCDIFGAGPLKSGLNQLIKECKVGHLIKINDPISQTELAKKMSNYNFMIQSSKTDTNGDKEGIPNSLKEAMALGLRVITTDHAGIPELIQNEGWAKIIPEGDVIKLSEAILEFSMDSSIYRADFEGRRSFIEEKFSLAGQVSALEDTFIEVLNQYKS